MKKARNVIKDNALLAGAIRGFDKQKKAIWQKVAYELAKPRRNKVEVNLSKIDVYAKDGDFVLVPGKVLGAGNITKKLTIAAFSFSGTAKQLITQAGARAISLEQLMSEKPDGKDILILK